VEAVEVPSPEVPPEEAELPSIKDLTGGGWLCGNPRLQTNPLGALWDRLVPRTAAGNLQSICSQANRAATRAQYCVLARTISHLLNTTFVVLIFFTKK